MSDQPGSLPENPLDNATPWVASQIREYLDSDGAKPAFRNGAPLLLLTTLGRKSQQWRRTCLIGAPFDGDFLIVASLGGADHHPEWYLNLRAHPKAYLQVGPEFFPATARTATEEEKPPRWQHMVSLFPDYAAYQEKTDRQIPVVIMTRSSS